MVSNKEDILKILKYFQRLRDNTGILDFYHRDDRRIFWEISKLMDKVVTELEKRKPGK